MSGQDYNTNDVVVAKEIGYLRKGQEENEKLIGKFYGLLADHMAHEERKQKTLDWKINGLFAMLAYTAVNDSGAASSIGSWLKTLLPFLV